MKWNKRIKDLRIDHDMTQEQLAQKINVDTKTIIRYEKGETEPTVSTLIKIALLFDVSIDYIVGLKDIELINDSTTLYELENIINNLIKIKNDLS